MLVLTRKTGESIIIDKDIVLTVLEVKGDKIKVGIEAPSEIKIYRKEIYDEIKDANIEASQIIIKKEEIQKITSKHLKKSVDN
jgi:carbon storage regulator